MQTYAAALVNLYYTQKSLGVNNHPNPRGTKLQAILKEQTRSEFERKKSEFVDQGTATLQKSYSLTDFENVVWGCWTSAISGSPTGQTIEAYFRTAIDFLLSHNMLLRSENRRAVELAVLFALPLANEGPKPCTSMIMIIANGKTKFLNKLEYRVAIRHRDPLHCSLSHTAFYLFYRGNCVREPTPWFQRRQQCYSAHLIKGSTPDKGLSYGVQLD